jgi:hypothetical protein
MAASPWGKAAAQSPRPSISVAPVLSVVSGTQAGFPVRLDPPGAIPAGAFLRLRGLPATAALSQGHSIAPGAWAVPIAALPSLMLLLPGETVSRSEISITLLASDGSVLANETTTLIAAPAAAKAAAVQATPPAQEPPAPVPPAPAPPQQSGPALSPEARERALRLVKKGDEQLAEGGVAQARLLYERAADAGLALGAMALAATYDAGELKRLSVLGLRPDPETARRWYQRALQLGAPEAAERLRRLGATQ